MKTPLKTQRIIAAALFTLTAVAVAYYPGKDGDEDRVSAPIKLTEPAAALPPVDPLSNVQPMVDVVFVLDTTGSMGGLIQAAKDKIWSIASTMASADPAPEVRVGLVAYRDLGDAYVTQVVDLTTDLDAIHGALFDLRAEGGGDGPEHVNQALYDAVHRMGWDRGENVYRTIFLVGDAPPHMDYQDDVKYPKTLEAAGDLGITVNSIQAGNSQDTTQSWQRIAQLGQGAYFQVAQNGSAVAIATPYDEALAKLGAELDSTRLYYGSIQERESKHRKLEASERVRAMAAPAVMARRADFLASKSGKAALSDDQELVEAVTSGRLDLKDLDIESLPEPLRVMRPEQREAEVKRQGERRDALKERIQDLSTQRSDYLREKVAASADAGSSLDHKIYSAVREQGAAAGLRYESDAPAY